MHWKRARAATWRNKAHRREALTGFAFLLPSALGVALFSVAPMLQTLAQSFQSASGGFAGLENYTEVLQNAAFRQASGNTFKFILVCVPLLIAVSFGAALLLNKAFPSAAWLRAGFLIPFAVPVASVAMLWTLLFHNNGAVNGIITALGGTGRDYLNTGASFSVLVISYIWRNAGYDMVLFLAGLSTISPALYEASAIDGAGGFRQFLYITLPQMTPTLGVVAILSLLNAFKSYREAYLVAGNYPPGEIYLLQHLFNNWFAALEIEKLSAAAVLVALVIFLLILLLQRAWKGGDET